MLPYVRKKVKCEVAVVLGYKTHSQNFDFPTRQSPIYFVQDIMEIRILTLLDNIKKTNVLTKIRSMVEMKKILQFMPIRLIHIQRCHKLIFVNVNLHS